jgi:hypothetical protein
MLRWLAAALFLFSLAESGCYVREARPAPCPRGVWIEGHYGPRGRWHPAHWRCPGRPEIIEVE